MEATLKVKGGEVAVSQADESDLQWYATECKNQQKKSLAVAELKRRGIAVGKSGGRGRGRADSTAIQKAQSSALSGVKHSLGKAIHDPAAVTKHLQDMAASFHIVTPQTTVEALPEGFGVAVSYVSVNPDATLGGPKEVYDVSGRLGLSMDTLKRIAAAAGVDWDPQQCGRLDDGSDPHYVHYRAVGYVRNFDGSVRTITGEVEMDLREGSPQVEEIREKAERRAKKEKRDNDGGHSQLLEQRKFILRHAESKAKNRAIADMGVKRSYAPKELEKPFAVAKLQFTGQSADPELRRTFAIMNAERALDGQHRLYGARGPAPTRPTLPAFHGHSPPPVGSASPDSDDDDDMPPWAGSTVETTHEPAPDTPRPQQAPPTAATEQQQTLVGDGYDARDTSKM